MSALKNRRHRPLAESIPQKKLYWGPLRSAGASAIAKKSGAPPPFDFARALITLPSSGKSKKVNHTPSTPPTSLPTYPKSLEVFTESVRNAPVRPGPAAARSGGVCTAVLSPKNLEHPPFDFARALITLPGWDPSSGKSKKVNHTPSTPHCISACLIS